MNDVIQILLPMSPEQRGKLLRQFRRDGRKTQIDIVDSSRGALSQSMVSRIEAGDNDLSTVQAYVTALVASGVEINIKSKTQGWSEASAAANVAKLLSAGSTDPDDLLQAAVAPGCDIAIIPHPTGYSCCAYGLTRTGKRALIDLTGKKSEFISFPSKSSSIQATLAERLDRLSVSIVPNRLANTVVRWPYPSEPLSSCVRRDLLTESMIA